MILWSNSSSNWGFPKIENMVESFSTNENLYVHNN